MDPSWLRSWPTWRILPPAILFPPLPTRSSAPALPTAVGARLWPSNRRMSTAPATRRRERKNAAASSNSTSSEIRSLIRRLGKRSCGWSACKMSFRIRFEFVVLCWWQFLGWFLLNPSCPCLFIKKFLFHSYHACRRSTSLGWFSTRSTSAWLSSRSLALSVAFVLECSQRKALPRSYSVPSPQTNR